MSGRVKATVSMKAVNRLLRDKGLTGDGDVQTFHTGNVLRRIVKYMPYRTGATIKLTINGTDINRPEIVTEAPYAKYLFYGKVMAGRAPKRATDIDLVYTQTKHLNAGPFWDRALVAAEGAALTADLQRYINRRNG